jgi:hypothetical protein
MIGGVVLEEKAGLLGEFIGKSLEAWPNLTVTWAPISDDTVDEFSISGCMSIYDIQRILRNASENNDVKLSSDLIVRSGDFLRMVTSIE